MPLEWPAPLPSERQTGGPEVANSHGPKARGQGYGAAGPMSTRSATRTPCHAQCISAPPGGGHQAGGSAPR